jgi:hypothetical protein
MWVYIDKLQIKFTLRSGPVIFWPSCDPWTLEFGQIFSCHHLLRHAWIYWLEFGIWVYNDELQIKFTFHPGSMIFGRVMTLGLWNLAKYLVVSPLYFTMIWYAVLMFWYECIIISYRSTLKFVLFRLNDFLSTYSRWVWNLATYLVVTTFVHYDLRYWLDFLVCEYTDEWLNDFRQSYAPWTINFGQIFSCHHALRYWLDFWYLEL